MKDEQTTSAPIPGVEILDVNAAATFLTVSKNTLLHWLKTTDIPHRRIGKTILFTRAALIRWVSAGGDNCREGK